MFPKHAQKWDTDENVRTVLDAATKAHGKGYKNFHFIGGDDRRQSIEDLLRRYNGNLYQFDNMYAHSMVSAMTLQRVLKGMSASKLRGFAEKDDFERFGQFMPNVKGFDPKQMFEMIQRYQQSGMNEQTIREYLYHTNQIYLVGEMVESLTSGLVGEVHRWEKSSHLRHRRGIMFKNFLNEVHSV